MRGGRTRSGMRLNGTVSSGLGRAHVFMAQEHYQNQFKVILGTNAWPGTLNVQLSGDDLASYVALRNISGVDTLDIKEETKSSASEIDMSGIETFRVRGSGPMSYMPAPGRAMGVGARMMREAKLQRIEERWERSGVTY